MTALETLAGAIPAMAKDVQLNLESVLQRSGLAPAQRWGVAVAAAAAARNPKLSRVLIAEARREVEAAVLDDALAAAALMGMNNVYYRFRHLVEKPSYRSKPARLRMTRITKPATSKLDFELFSLAVSAINGCGACLAAHEHVVTQAGLTEEQVHDAIRIAATVNAAAIALELGELCEPSAAAADAVPIHQAVY
jgi:lipoyl-dependent peroxiredoxin subunit D